MGVVRRRSSAAWAAVAISCSVVACGDDEDAGPPATTPGTPVPVVVDTDLAIDDLIAITFLLSSSDVEVTAITVSGTGEVRCPAGVDVVRGLLTLLGDEGVPVACGRSDPLAGDHAFPTEWRDGADAAWGMELPAPTGMAGADGGATAVELLAEALSPGGVTLLTLGPLTNVAEAFRDDEQLAEQVTRIVVMGGAVDVPGNIIGAGIEAPNSEWNLYVDPTAAAEVVSSGAPIMLVGLDATNDAPITGDFLELFRANTHTEAATFVAALLDNNPLVWAGDAYFWDPLAAAVVVDPEVVTTTETELAVVTEEGVDSGRTIRSDDGHPVTVAVGAETARFEELLIRTLDGLQPGAAIVTPPTPVGEGVIRYEGSVCSYEGPSSVAAGRMRLTFETDDQAWGGGIVQLTGELTVEEILAWLAEHSPSEGEAIPGVGPVSFVPPGIAMYVDVAAPSVAALCGSQDPIPELAATIAVR